jgi:hypothetical protein
MEGHHMPIRKYRIRLTEAEREKLTKRIKTGKSPARQILRANILLLSDASVQKPVTVSALANLLYSTPTTVQTVRNEYATKGLDAVLE